MVKKQSTLKKKHLSIDSFPPTVRKNMYSIAQKLKAHGFACYTVGGSVRDCLLNIRITDIDFTTNATPEQIKKIFPRAIPSGIKYGTMTIPYNQQAYEITTFRTDLNYDSKSRNPKQVQFSETIHADLARRDFTINALAYNPLTNEMIDDFHGIQDLCKKILRCIGDPQIRFQEDPLRVIRACRLAAKLDFAIEEKTLEAMKHAAISQRIQLVAKERMMQEFKKGLNSKMIALLLKVNLISLLFPQYFANLTKKTQVSSTTIDQALCKKSLICLLSMEKKSCGVLSNLAFFYFANEASKDALLADGRNLKFSRTDLKFLDCYYNYFQFQEKSLPTKQVNPKISNQKMIEARKFLSHLKKMITENRIDQFFEQLTDYCQYPYSIPLLKQTLKNEALLVTDLAINGSHLIKWKISPQLIGNILQGLLRQVLENPDLNQYDQLSQIVQKNLKQTESHPPSTFQE